VALGLLDQWLTGHDRSAPADLGKLTRLPAGHWTGERVGWEPATCAVIAGLVTRAHMG
jgi:hypothetical protein